MMTKHSLDWSQLAFSSKKPLRDLKATFIAAPREISTERFDQLIKERLPSGNIVLGLAKEDYVDGFESQPHFRTLKLRTIRTIIDKVNRSKSPYKIYTLHYFQRELNYILQKVPFKNHLFINGSWHKAFHNLAVYYTLANQHRPYELVSPFESDDEAKAYTKALEKEIKKAIPLPVSGAGLSESEMMRTAFKAATYSFDYNYQTGVALGKSVKGGYRFIAATYNAVVPFQGFAMHYGAARETHFSPPHDVNHYDTVHAEVELILGAAHGRFDLKNTSLFINTLPCPTCSRMFTESGISEFFYQDDHSAGYAIAMLEAAGKKVSRIVPQGVVSNV